MNIRDNTEQLDYRTVDNKFMLEQTAEKKEILEQQIKKLQPKTKILYNVVSDKQNKNNFFEDFANIYHRKCAYCGQEFFEDSNISRTKYCSTDCRVRANIKMDENRRKKINGI